MAGSGYDPQKLSRTKATASGFSLANASTFVRGTPAFSFSRTEPIQGQNSGLLWPNSTGEGQQYHQETTNAHNGFDAFSPFQINQNGAQGPNPNNRSQWSASPTHAVESEQMIRLVSPDSVGSHAQVAPHTASYDQSRSSRLFQPVSQAPYISSSRSDVTGRSSPVDLGLYAPAPQFELQSFENVSFPGPENITGEHSIYQREAGNGLPNSSVSMTAEPSFSMFATSDGNFAPFSNGSNLVSQVPVSQESVIFNSATLVDSNSPAIWDETLHLESQRSSPTLLVEDWALNPQAQMTTSATNSPLNYSPSLEGLSPRYVPDLPELVDLGPYTTGDRVIRKPIGPRQSKVVSDLASRQQRHQEPSETSDDSIRMVGRSSLDIDNTARDHPLYQNVAPKADGLYHCPWEGQDGCLHKPEKLKCNYDKFVDSHLKPYRCKVHACENSRFSSTACLLRHEREAHAMHGHGDKPYLCTYDNCERGVIGNGFPRHWNLRDHMKRVHNDSGSSPKVNVNGTPPPANATARGKKRKVEGNDTAAAGKVLKKIATPSAVLQSPEPSLVDRYIQSAHRLQEVVKQLSDPRNSENMVLLRSAGECLKVMAQSTQRINANGITSFKQQSGLD